MKTLTTFLSLLCVSQSLFSQTQIAGFGESTSYVTMGRSLRLGDGLTAATISDINRPFSESAAMQPDPDTDPGTPVFFGGWGYADGTGEDFDFSPQVANDNAFSGGFDGPYFTLNIVGGTAETFGYLMMFDVASVPYGYLDAFLFSATRNTGTGNAAGARAVLRVGSSYYISANETLFASSYVEGSLDFADLETYDPSTSIVYTAGTPASLSLTDEVTAVGIYFERRWEITAASGDARLGVGKISVTALTSGLFTYGFPESADHVTSGRALRLADGSGSTSADINRAFSESAPMEPVWGSDPGVGSFFGGWGYADGTGEALDFSPQFSNNQGPLGGNDGPLFALNILGGFAEAFGYLMMFETIPFDYADLSSFVFKAVRSTGTGNAAGARPVLRVGTMYYIGSNETNITGTYAEGSLDFSTLETYNPVTGVVYAAGTATALNPTDLVDAVGVYFERSWTELSATGNARLWVGKIEATVNLGIPAEPLIPVIAASAVGGNLVITVPSESGFDYQLQSATSGLGGWTDVPGELQSGTGADLTFSPALPGPADKDFYRVEVTVAP